MGIIARAKAKLGQLRLESLDRLLGTGRWRKIVRQRMNGQTNLSTVFINSGG